MASRPVQIGDIVRISEAQHSTNYIIQEIKEGKIYVADQNNPQDKLVLISTPEGWQVAGWTSRHTVDFLPGASFPPISDINQRIFAELSDQELLRMCQTDKYFRELCGDENFWHLRLLHKYGPQIVAQKPPFITYRQQYKSLVKASMGKFSSYLKHKRYDILDYLSKFMIPENIKILVIKILKKGTIENIRWLLNNHNIKLNWETLQLRYAIGAKNYPVVKYLLELYPEYRLKFNDIAKLGRDLRLDILDILFLNANLDVYRLLDSASAEGNIELLDWLVEKGIEINTMPDIVTPRTLNWLVAHNYEFSQEDIHRIIDHATITDHLDILQWLREKNLLLPSIDLSYVLRKPGGFHEKIINWLITQGAPIDQNVINLAIIWGNLPAVKIFSSQGISLGKNEALLALDNNHSHIVRYILEQM